MCLGWSGLLKPVLAASVRDLRPGIKSIQRVTLHSALNYETWPTSCYVQFVLESMVEPGSKEMENIILLCNAMRWRNSWKKRTRAAYSTDVLTVASCLFALCELHSPASLVTKGPMLTEHPQPETWKTFHWPHNASNTNFPSVFSPQLPCSLSGCTLSTAFL